MLQHDTEASHVDKTYGNFEMNYTSHTRVLGQAIVHQDRYRGLDCFQVSRSPDQHGFGSC